MSFAEALVSASHLLEEAQPFQVVTHGDVDGVAAGALAVSAFQCEVIIQKQLRLREVDTSKFTLFLDLGSSQLEEIRSGFKNYFVVDHHPDFKQCEVEREHMVNPWMFGINGTEVLSAAATMYLVVRQLGEAFLPLSYLGVLGALGDRQPLERENAQIKRDAVASGVLKEDILCTHPMQEFVDVVNACCRNSKKELALDVCLLHSYEEGRKELDLYNETFQRDLTHLEGRWDTIEEENRKRAAYFIYDGNITHKYAGELASALTHHGKPIIILVNDTDGIKISGRATPALVAGGVDLGKAFAGYGGGHNIAAGAFLEDEDAVETFIQVVDERLHHMVNEPRCRVLVDIPVKDAEKVMQALAIDNKGYDIIVKAEKGHIRGEVEGPPGTVKNTTDDLLACIISAVQMMEGEP